ncbi:phytoene desaturase [Breznakibacter xylanolyticus]|uniref:Phytoene desaturase n=1 Tax=Breznakibacter xylanolyticus TaxID=990 RepID=A0A2W7N8A0_9BACT|nr:phytoene desaturase family protein [Breznakibacter xylanolyticus]PZX16381.1 phytoene desaturase [Breznakibacter xylanolyticus]
MNPSVIIVGAGMGGLATALRLSTLGYKVQIVEKFYQAGGRLNRIQKDGFTFDTGPSFFSMSYEFHEFARECNLQLPFSFRELDPLYSVNFRGSDQTYFLYKDIARLAEQFEQEEPDFEAKMERYLAKCGGLFHDTVDLVIKQNFNSLVHYLTTLARVNPRHLPVLFRKFHDQVNRYFDSERARQIISLVAFFLGRTPFDTSAVYTLLSYTEFRHDGYYNVEGGMYKIVEGLVDELARRGVSINYNTEISAVESRDGKVTALVDLHNHFWRADMFVVNADAAFFRGKVLERKAFSPRKLDIMQWTMGYLTIYLGIKRQLPNVHHHNYYLGDNFYDYARDIYKNPGTLQKPYYYVNVLSKHNPDCAPQGCESLFFVCPVPDLRYKADWSDRDAIVDSIIDDFSQRVGVDIKPEIVSRTVFTPQEWEKHFNLYRGSGLGLAHNLMQIGAFRPHNVDEKFKNLFYVGASTVPGAGLPMAVISSKLVTQRVVALRRKFAADKVR